MVHYKTAALQETTLSDKKNTKELSLSETASRRTLGLFPRQGGYCLLVCELPALTPKKQYARNRRFRTPEKRTRKMKTKLQQNVRLFVRPPAGLSVRLSILFEMDYKKTAQSGSFFFFLSKKKEP